jgi:hypothetical protein
MVLGYSFTGAVVASGAFVAAALFAGVFAAGVVQAAMDTAIARIRSSARYFFIIILLFLFL